MRKLLRHLTLTVVGALCCFLWSCGRGASPEIARRPNVLVIVTDDQGYADLGAYDHAAADINTTNMDRIARTGVRFTQAYVSAPVCSPSRAGWNTGQYQQRWDSSAGWFPGLHPQVTGIAEYFKANGYATAKFGKSDFGGKTVNQDHRDYPLNHGFDEFLGFCAHSHDYFRMSEEDEKNSKPLSTQVGPLYHNRSRKGFEKSYTTEVFTDAAIEYVEQHANQPFFMTLSYNSVHDLIHEVPVRYLEKVGVKPIPEYDPKTMGNYRDYYNQYCAMDPATDADMRKYYRANLMCLDDNIGRLLDRLDGLNLAENTLIVFLSDNGGAPNTGSNNRPLRGSKYTLYEGGIRVPVMVSWPAQLPQNITYKYPVSTLDILPTCLEVAGISQQESSALDGTSLLSALKVGVASQTSTQPMFWQFTRQWAVRDGAWKLVETYSHTRWAHTSQVRKGPKVEGRPMLFNLETDIGEQYDLYEQHPDVVERLTGLYEQWQEDLERHRISN
jgi:arylsulfatase A-like enzyme